MARLKSDRGTALLEMALTLPLLLLVSIGIFEFGRAYQYQQVITNAAREGARVAVLPSQPDGAVQARVYNYLTAGMISNPSSAKVEVATTQVAIGGGNTVPGSRVTVTYPYSFMVLQPVARLVVKSSTVGKAIPLIAAAEMRNEQ